MRIASMCTLAFAICGGGRETEEEKTWSTVASKTSTKGSPTSRWLAKSLVLGASVHSTSGFGEPALGSSVHAASGSRRPAGVRALEPLTGWRRDTINDRVFKPINAKRAVNRIEAENAKAERIKDVLVAGENVHRFKQHHVPWEAKRPKLEKGLQDLKKLPARIYEAERIENVLVAAENAHRHNEHDVPWQARRSKLEHDLQGMKKKHLEKLWLGVMAENAKAERIKDVLVAAENVYRFKKHDVPWEEWRPKLENYLLGLKKKHLKKLWLGVMAENAKAERIEDVLVAAENVGWYEWRSQGRVASQAFPEHDVPWEEWRPKLENDLQALKKHDLERLWLDFHDF